MASVQRLINALVDLVMSPFQSLAPLWGLSLFALTTGLLMLLVFRFTSDQERIRETKDRVKGHLLELWLFRDDPRTVLGAQWQILRLNGRYLRLTVRPTLVLFAPIALLLISLDGWFGYRPLEPGEATILSVRLGTGDRSILDGASLSVNGGLTVETPPLRIPASGEVDWRLRASGVGVHRAAVEVSGRRVEKEVVVSHVLAQVSPSRVGSTFWELLLHPTEPPIPADSDIRRIDVRYPPRSIELLGWELHWLVYFFALSIVFAFAVKRLVGVEL